MNSRKNLRYSKRLRWHFQCSLLVMLAVVSTVANGQTNNVMASNASSQEASYTASLMGDSASSGALSQPAPTSTSEQAVLPTKPLPKKSSPTPSVPMGISGASLPKPGALVFNLNQSDGMNGGAMVGASSVSSAWAVQNISSTFTPAGVGVPHIVRNTPIDVNRLVSKAGFTYGLTDKLALNISAQYLETRQNVDVYQGMSGTTLLGVSKTSSAGFGDSSVSGIYSIYRGKVNRINGTFGFSLPTGSTDVTDTTFNNSGVWATKRAVYTLQLGTGTFDAMPGITYVGVIDKWTWGAAYRSQLPMDKNVHGYRWGNYHEFDTWGGYKLLPGIDTTLRVYGSVQGSIVGYDPQIIGYGPCSNPLWFGGKHMDLFPGISVSGRRFGLPSVALSVEGDAPMYQDLNGLHLGKQFGIAVGLKYNFHTRRLVTL